MPSRYAQWMYDWETRLTSVDNNRVVRPLDWGLDWTHSWPGRNGGPVGSESFTLAELEYFSRFNDRIIRDSDDFLLLPDARPIFAWSAARCRCSARAKCPIRGWKKKFVALTPIFCVSPRRWRRLSRK